MSLETGSQTQHRSFPVRLYVCPLERGSQLVVIHRGVTKCDTPGLQLWRSMAFTEQGVAMLSSVLRSQTAIEVNISIMRAFVLMRQMVAGYEELLKRIEELEASTDTQFNDLSGIDPAFEPVPRAEATPQNRIRYL